MVIEMSDEAVILIEGSWNVVEIFYCNQIYIKIGGLGILVTLFCCPKGVFLSCANSESLNELYKKLKRSQLRWLRKQ